ncbi:prolipoprotein diacylglyceryl transferase [Oerskovia sp. KBS0722]|uniref:prolipoprotein diacylglyceryl transferase n=1 Tax=Oerskovia sp. KBS0722 TaxID=1179673 RepID=UPI00110D8895|nr:prolipoprotein diacylglyceryl transferase [Oerskovia sp. KBS0722]QDW63268.1 prolipoprotein diacylglyceryl transferase [Oerskovia sp. KBS0722]
MNGLVSAVGPVVASIPSPSEHTWYIGPFPLRAYALAILAGIAVAVWLTRKRWVERGGEADDVLEIAFWAVPFGIVGGRLYHVISSPDAYWGPDGDPLKALRIWDGGLGIWGAIALGAVGAYIGCRRQKVSFPAFADALAPGLLLAQAIGRLGNWFNQELFGSPTTLPWGLEVDPNIADYVCSNAGLTCGAGTLFHPTFLYEMLWNVAAAFLLIYLDRRFRLGHGRVFWLYVLFYTLGRVWIEMLRIDDAELVLGLRLNVWTSILVGVGALIAFIVVGRRNPGREETVSLDAAEPEQADAARPDPGR